MVDDKTVNVRWGNYRDDLVLMMLTLRERLLHNDYTVVKISEIAMHERKVVKLSKHMLPEPHRPNEKRELKELHTEHAYFGVYQRS